MKYNSIRSYERYQLKVDEGVLLSKLTVPYIGVSLGLDLKLALKELLDGLQKAFKKGIIVSLNCQSIHYACSMIKLAGLLLL